MGGELPLLPFGNPIGFVPASRGGFFIESSRLAKESICSLLNDLVERVLDKAYGPVLEELGD